MIKSHKILKKSHENVNLCDKKSPHSKKSYKNVNSCDKKSQNIEKNSQKCKFMS